MRSWLQAACPDVGSIRASGDAAAVAGDVPAHAVEAAEERPDTPTAPTVIEVSEERIRAAHGYGWLHHVASRDHHFVVFQYGGSVEAHSWSSEHRFALFSLATPTGTELLEVVDRDDLE